MKKVFLIMALLGMTLVSSCGNKEVEQVEAVDSTVVDSTAVMVDTTATVVVDSAEVVVAQ